tara:strand:+ start:510 stop:1721 length:1212 start_codon:yes stop_codon:yes gene_type:complete
MTKQLEKFIGKLTKEAGIPVEPFKDAVGTVDDLFGTNVEATEGLLPSSRSVNVPDEQFPVGKFRIKETGVEALKKGGTFLGLANTKEAVKIAKKLGFEPGMVIDVETLNQYPELKNAITQSRDYIEASLPAGTTFPKPKADETFDVYYKRVKDMFPSGTSMVALMNESAKQFQLRYPEFKAGPKLLELINEGTIPFDLEGEIQRGLKIPDPKNKGVKKIITELLENNKGYLTVADSIDPYIDDLVKNFAQSDYDKFAVDLRNSIDPSTNKPYTREKIKTLVANRLKFAVAQYYNTQVTPDIINSVYDSMRGSTSAVNAEKIAENKFKTIAPKKLAAFTTAIVSLAKSGGASELLSLGSKAALGTGIGAGLEVLFPNEAQAAEFMTPKERGELLVKQKFGIDSL